MIHLTHKNLEATIEESRGGLVTSLKIAGEELLWLSPEFNAADSSWPSGGIPFCFPFAGRVWNSGTLYQYEVDGKTFHMPLHGFAYGMDWRVDAKTPSEVTLSLQDNAASKVLFPFGFSIQTTFSLTDSGLRIEAKITQRHGHQQMPVAMGWHPYFNLSKQKNSTLDVAASHYHVVTPAGAAGKMSEIIELGPKPWSVRQPLLNSLIFTDLIDNHASLNLDNGCIRLQFGPNKTINHVVVWSNNLDEFYCVEPWMSLPDAVNIASGLRWLAPNESLKNWMTINLEKT